MSEMIERVAQQLYESYYADRVNWNPKKWSELYGFEQQSYLDWAKSAIAALRHPNKTMIEQGKAATGDGNIFLTDQQIKDCWYAMICAALKETEHA